MNDWLAAKSDSIQLVNSPSATCGIAKGRDHEPSQPVICRALVSRPTRTGIKSPLKRARSHFRSSWKRDGPSSTKGFRTVTTFSYELSGTTAFALVRPRGGRWEPIGRYIACVGASLLALLFVANWFLPQPLAEPSAAEPNRPIIRISSVQQPPERIVIDTNVPMIAPLPTSAAEAISDEPPTHVRTYASVVPPLPIAGVERTKTKKKQVNKLASKQPSVTVIASVALLQHQHRPPGYYLRMSFLDS